MEWEAVLFARLEVVIWGAVVQEEEIMVVVEEEETMVVIVVGEAVVIAVVIAVVVVVVEEEEVMEEEEAAVVNRQYCSCETSISIFIYHGRLSSASWQLLSWNLRVELISIKSGSIQLVY
jgi:hypothetical protein